MVATGVIFTTGVGNHGVMAENTNADSDASVRAENDGSGASISTEGDNAHGVYARNEGTGQVEAINDVGFCTQADGTSRDCIQTSGDSAHGVFAHNTGGTMDAQNTGGVLSENSFGGTVTVASGSYGVYALNEGVIQPTSLTSLSLAAAVFATNNNPSVDISVRAENKGTGSITTSMIPGLYARTSGTGRVEAINSATGLYTGGWNYP